MQLKGLPAQKTRFSQRALALLKMPSEGFTKPFLTTRMGRFPGDFVSFKAAGAPARRSYKQPFQSLIQL
jgi:hypothetical protein